ncbi:uncharacterized protein B0H18DRAFT_953808 [Fomitopsis serialis]|uniref:uncharacterized protein n=1 Tax=Fomitopsis serialis TaxID=139415 RepID=UPI002008B8E3|nr:uncharacterized protein B0H18DRAFT_953808 [Neoantrodia serialis]KAH9928906.1 hypothetical protein B0H18DRAFT_953808 [Neoantrodia serialis]
MEDPYHKGAHHLRYLRVHLNGGGQDTIKTLKAVDKRKTQKKPVARSMIRSLRPHTTSANVPSPSTSYQSTKGTGNSIPKQDEAGNQKDGQNGGHAEHRPTDPWSKLAETVWHRTRADIERWWSELNSLLTFAGLFSAVVTAFAVLGYSILTAQIASPTDPDLLHRYVPALWFAALVCALAAASVAISVGQWLNYLLTPAGLVEFGPRQKLRIWNLRRIAFDRWQMDFLVGIAPVLLQIALTLFLVGLVGFLWTVSVAVAMPTLILVAFVLFFQFITVVAPAMVAYSPFQSPQARLLRWMWVTSGFTICWAAYKATHWPSGCVQCKMITRRLQAAHASLERVMHRLAELRLHCSWVKNEKLYLQDDANSTEIDTTLFASTFTAAVTKDDESTLHYIQQCLNDMPIDLARSNATALVDACDQARLDNAIRAGVDHGDHFSSWSYDSLDKHVITMMGHVVVDVMTRLIHSQLPKHMNSSHAVKELDEMCVDMQYVLQFLDAEDIKDRLCIDIEHQIWQTS